MNTIGVDSGFFGWVMRMGNKLPNPFFLFVGLMVTVLVLSCTLNQFGVGVQTNIYDKATGVVSNQYVQVQNLLSLSYLHSIMQNFVKIYTSFPPLGLAMVTMIGIGYVQQTGFFDAALKNVVRVVPPSMVVFVVVLMSISSAVAGNAGIIISATLAAAVFASIGKNPVLGAVVGYASAHGGEPSNFILTGWKILMTSITDTATAASGIPVTVHPLLNYFFFGTMVIALALVITFVTEKIMPKLMDTTWGDKKKKETRPCSEIVDDFIQATEHTCSKKNDEVADRVTYGEGTVNLAADIMADIGEKKPDWSYTFKDVKDFPVPTDPVNVTLSTDGFLRAFGFDKEIEARGLKWAGIGTLLYVIILLLGTIPDHGFLCNADGKLLPKSPFISGIVFILVGWFMIVGTCYGLGARTVRSQGDVAKFMRDGLTDASTFFVVCLPAALFVKFFSDSNISVILSAKGSVWLSTVQFTGLPLAMSFVLLVMFLNLFVTNGAAKWMIMAPIFVPMFYNIGFTPEMTQTIYEIGDAITDPIAPVNYYIPVVITIMEKYRKDAIGKIGIGSVISMTLPYSIVFGTVLVASFCLWYLMGWPIGPGVYLLR